MKAAFLGLGFLALGGTSAQAASVSISLYATPLMLSRTDAVTAELTLVDGTSGRVTFSADDIAGGLITKTFDGATWDQVVDCKADWSFVPLATDVVPSNAASVDSLDFDCTYNTASDAVELTPLTSVQTMRVTVPEAALAARGARALSYTLGISQMHGPAWVYQGASGSFARSGSDMVAEYVVFTGGCLTYALTATWVLESGAAEVDAVRVFMGDGVVLQ